MPFDLYGQILHSATVQDNDIHVPSMCNNVYLTLIKADHLKSGSQHVDFISVYANCYVALSLCSRRQVLIIKIHYILWKNNIKHKNSETYLHKYSHIN